MVGGKNIDAKEEANTTPSPIANGPPIIRNLSLGAQTATVDRPPTTPAVYQAARIMICPPTRESGARTAPWELLKMFDIMYFDWTYSSRGPNLNLFQFKLTYLYFRLTIIAQWAAHANCLAPTPGWYGMDLATIPEPIIAAIVAIIETQPVRATRLNRVGVRKIAAALAAVKATEPPK